MPEYGIADAEAGIRNMLATSLAAVAGPVHDPDGRPIDPDAITPVRTPCGDGRARAQVTLELVTDDNARSLARMLRAREDAGYASDHAIREDIRYSDTLPIQKMSIRDSTTIDGHIRMQITAQCSATQP